MTRQSRLAVDAATQALPGIGPKRSRDLADAGVHTVLDVLCHLPSHYSDRRRLDDLSPETLERAARDQTPLTLVGRLRGVRRIFTRRRGLQLVQGTLHVEDHKIRCTWFNRPYLAQQNDENRDVLVHGIVRRSNRGLELLNADVTTPEMGGGITSHYRERGGLGDRAWAKLQQTIREIGPDVSTIPDPLPDAFRTRHGFPTLGEALEALHAPAPDVDFDALEQCRTPAQQRLLYDELFQMQVELARARSAVKGRVKPHRIEVDDGIRALARDMLPFRLTGAQKRCVAEIVEDLRAPVPMLRLLQGDVGCGKTIIAALAALVVIRNDLQVAVLAPTDLLADQLARELTALLGELTEIATLSRSSEDGEAVRQGLACGQIQLVVGTHALIQDAVDFHRLGLVIIDEQHRFGVHQRLALTGKGRSVDVLLMTATPIPRSLALSAFGDLDLSTVDELPPGRAAVTTELRSPADRERLFTQIDEEIRAGGRAFVVFPRIEGEDEDVSSIESVGMRYAEVLDGRAEVLTGRSSPEERRRVLEAFRSGDLGCLLATTVIEVGLDVPEATWMVIEGAERFGLSQLHQLRGRVGRGGRRGRCVVIPSGEMSESTADRLEVFCGTSDGFRLAEEDLRLRGPGELLGVAQSGTGAWTSTRLAAAMHLIEAARNDAREWVQGDGAEDPAAETSSVLRAG